MRDIVTACADAELLELLLFVGHPAARHQTGASAGALRVEVQDHLAIGRGNHANFNALALL